MLLGSQYFNPSVLSGFALVQTSGCTGSEVSVGLPQWLMWKEVTMNVVALYVTLEKTLLKQAVRSLRYLKTYLSSTQPPAISSGVYSSSRRIFFYEMSPWGENSIVQSQHTQLYSCKHSLKPSIVSFLMLMLSAGTQVVWSWICKAGMNLCNMMIRAVMGTILCLTGKALRIQA